jgi:hypothetical protein
MDNNKKTKNVQLHSKTSTPIKYLHDLNLTKNDSNSKTISQKNSKTEDSYLLHEKKSCWIDDLTKNIKSHEESIKQYEIKLEKCRDAALRNYNIKSASDLRKQITLLLNIYSKNFVDIKIVDEIKILSSKVDSFPGRRLRTRYTVVNERIRCRIRPYFAIKHVIVLRSYMSVTVYGEIRKR